MFAAALACWRRLCSGYEPSETVRNRLLGYAFSGVAATLFQEVMGEAKRGIIAEAVWTLMAAKLYTDDMIENQRANFNAASLEAEKTCQDWQSVCTSLHLAFQSYRVLAVQSC
jgi:hypothetical protein